MRTLGNLKSEKFPVFSLRNRDPPPETGSLSTPPTATQALGAETSRLDPRMDPEKPANSRGLGG